MSRFRFIAQTSHGYAQIGCRTFPHSWKLWMNDILPIKKIKSPCFTSKMLSPFSSSSSRNGRHAKNDLSSTLACVEILSEKTNEQQAKEIVKLLSPNTVQELQEARDKVAMLHDQQHDLRRTTMMDDKKSMLKTESKSTPEPSKRDLYLTAMNRGIPFIGFGFLDNALLIIAGEAIDENLGLAFGISTMCAAALGNIVSDLAGVALGTVIEDFCTKLGIPTPNLSSAQRSLRSVRYAGQVGCAIGITLGCFLGMFPLLFIPNNKSKATNMNEIKEEDN